MGTFGNQSGGKGKMYADSMSLASGTRGKVGHVPQKASSFPGKTGMTRKDGGEPFSNAKDATNPVPGRFDNDSISDKKPPATAYKGMPVASGNTGTKRSGSPSTSTKGFVDKRAREFTGYK